MGAFKVNGTDITVLGEVIGNSDARAKSAFFSSGKISVPGLSNASKTLANAPVGAYSYWGLHNIVGDKLKVNGVADTVAMRGTRPNFKTVNDVFLGGTVGTYKVQHDPATHITTITNPYNTNTVLSNWESVFYFQIVGAGGGGGGGGVNWLGGATGGAGGGGGASIVGLIDLLEAPDHYITIEVGAGGAGGGGKTNGAAGGDTVVKNSSGSVLCKAEGGKGGVRGVNSGGTASNAGAGGWISYTDNNTYYRSLLADGGGSGGKSSSSGESTATITQNIPMDSITLTAKGQSGGANGSGGSNTGGGGGGASAPLIFSDSTGGTGGADRANGSNAIGLGAGGGGGGANAGGSGQAGGSGANGHFTLFY